MTHSCALDRVTLPLQKFLVFMQIERKSCEIGGMEFRFGMKIDVQSSEQERPQLWCPHAVLLGETHRSPVSLLAILRKGQAAAKGRRSVRGVTRTKLGLKVLAQLCRRVRADSQLCYLSLFTVEKRWA